MEINFSNIIELIVNNRTISRKDKQLAISRFLKNYSGKNKPTAPEERAVIETLSAIKKTYSIKDNGEKNKIKEHQTNREW